MQLEADKYTRILVESDKVMSVGWVSTTFLLRGSSSYSLCVQISGMSFGIKEVAVSPRIVYAIQFPLPHEQIGLPE